MMAPQAALLGNRLHLQHGPIDLVIGVDGNRQAAFEAARARFSTVLSTLMEEIDALRLPIGSAKVPNGEIAIKMHRSASLFGGFVTPMAGVAGAVAETVLGALMDAVPMRRAYVNNGGDIAFHLSEGQCFRIAIAGIHGKALGEVEIRDGDPIRGIATSGRQGRSLSMGIAQSVTVLAKTAADADVAATLIANAVDLPGHPAIKRARAKDVDERSDLGEQLVVTGCGPLRAGETQTALANGIQCAQNFEREGHIAGACLILDEQLRTIGNSWATDAFRPQIKQGQLEYA
jgi:ApbE superfamily uncharacterized protein (UPF0280 family)